MLMKRLKGAIIGNKVIPLKIIRKKFVPQPDITAYEVAYILSHCNMWTLPAYEVNFRDEQWNNLDPKYQRHFEDK